MPATSSRNHSSATALAAAIPIPVKTLDIKLDALGYPGWLVTMWVNPPADIWDAFIGAEAVSDAEWDAFGALFISWNFGDREGKLYPLPGNSAGRLKRGVL